jgi:hypothetical protein
VPHAAEVVEHEDPPPVSRIDRQRAHGATHLGPPGHHRLDRAVEVGAGVRAADVELRGVVAAAVAAGQDEVCLRNAGLEPAVDHRVDDADIRDGRGRGAGAGVGGAAAHAH